MSRFLGKLFGSSDAQPPSEPKPDEASPSLGATTVRSATVVMFLAATAASSLAADRPVLHSTKGPTRGHASGSLVGGSCNCFVSLPWDGSSTGLTSQTFTDAPLFTAFTFDDFVVPVGQTWGITGFHVDGFYALGYE